MDPDNQWLQLRQSSAAVATRRAGHHRGRPATRERSANAITVLKQKSVLASEVKTSTLVSSPTRSNLLVRRRANNLRLIIERTRNCYFLDNHSYFLDNRCEWPIKSCDLPVMSARPNNANDRKAYVREYMRH